jgi:hypothetical protein
MLSKKIQNLPNLHLKCNTKHERSGIILFDITVAVIFNSIFYLKIY